MGYLNSLGSVGYVLAIVGLIVQDARLLIPGFGASVSQGVFFTAAAACLLPAVINRQLPKLTPLPFVALFGVLILSDWFARGFTLFQGPGFRGDLIAAGVLSAILLTRGKKPSFTPAYVCALLLVVCEFLLASGGVPLLMDDNGVFFFRLELLKRFFPHIPFYYTAWDGGMDARDFFATGALNVFFLYWPLVNLSALKSTFNLVVAGVLAVVPSVSLFLACRILNYSQRTAAIAGILGLASSLQWFKWGLKFGTLGFLTTAGLFPLMLALYVAATRNDEEFSLRRSILFVLVSTLVFLWPLGCVMAAPLGVLLLIFYKRIAAKRYILAALAALLVLNAPWAMVFAKVSKVNSFVSGKNSVHSAVDFIAPSDERSLGSASKIFKTVHDNFVGANPLLIAFAIPGLALLGVFERRVILAVGVWLIGLGVFVSPYKPQLELGRFIVVALLLGAVPAARFIDELIGAELRGKIMRVSVSAVLGLLFLTPYAATNAMRNRTMEKFQFKEETLNDVAQLIEREGGAGRTLFSGFVLHEFDGGHAAPLTLLTAKPIVASSFAHNQWSYKQVFPEEFLKDRDVGIEEYLNLMNVTLVLAHEERWKRYFADAPDRFAKVGEAGPFIAFKRVGYAPSYLYSGDGEVRFSEDAISVNPKSTELVVKFRYFPFLKSSGCKISPYPVKSVQLIKLSECSAGLDVKISAKSAFQRVVE